jgi:hypothetical protein
VPTITETRYLLKNSGPHHVSLDAAIFLKDILDHLGHSIACEAIQAFEQLNDHRQLQGFPRLKRLNQYAVLRAIENLFSDTSVIEMGLQSQQDASPGGKK